MSERDNNPALAVRVVAPHRERWDKVGRLYHRPGYELPKNYQSLPTLRELLRSGNLVPSITNVIGVLGKPYLTDWAAKMVAEKGIEVGLKWGKGLQEAPERAFRYLKNLPHEYMTFWGTQGTNVHYACELISKGQDVSDLTLTEYEQACVNSFRDWLDKFQPTFNLVEATGFGKTTSGLGYAGTADFNININGVNILGDIKCTTDETPILMRDGSVKKAIDIRVGDEVVSWSEEDGIRYDPVSAVADNGDQEVYTLGTTLGQSLTVTSNHPVLTRTNDGIVWKKAEDMRADDKVFMSVGWNRSSDRTTEEWPYNKHLSPYLFGALWSLTHHNETPWEESSKVIYPSYSRDECFEELGSVGFPRTPDKDIKVKAGLRRVAHKARITVENLLEMLNSPTIPDFVMRAPKLAQTAFILGVQEVYGNKEKHVGKMMVEFQGIEPVRSLQQLYLNTGEISQIIPVGNGRFNLRVSYQSAYKDQGQFNSYGIEETSLLAVRKHVEKSHTVAIEVANSHTHVTSGLITHNTNRTGLHGEIALQLAANRNVTEVTVDDKTLIPAPPVDMTAGLHLSSSGYEFREVESSEEVMSTFEVLRELWDYYAFETVGDPARSVFQDELTPESILAYKDA